MGWNRGSEIFNDLIDILNDTGLDRTQREEVYRKMIHSLEEHDWDTAEECLGKDEVFDKIYKEFYPDEEEALYDDDGDEWDGSID